MAQYISKSALVAEIERLMKWQEPIMSDSISFNAGHKAALTKLLSFIDTLEVKEVDLDALGVLAEHLIACDAHLVTPKYTDKELNLLEEWAKNNKTQKGEEV